MQLDLAQRGDRYSLLAVIRRPARAFAWLFLVAYTLSGSLWARGFVLCFEADGHVRLESAAVPNDCGECCPGDEAESTGPRAPRVAACACLDVPLGAPEGALKKLERRSAASVAAGHVPARIEVRLELAPPPPLARVAELPRSQASATLACTRCTVLLV